jgi:hypothetical protein
MPIFCSQHRQAGCPACSDIQSAMKMIGPDFTHVSGKRCRLSRLNGKKESAFPGLPRQGMAFGSLQKNQKNESK